MARQNIIPDPAKRLFDAYMDFSGGLNSTVANDKLKDNEFPVMQNVDLSGRGSLKRRYGRILVANQAGNSQGIFQFYRQGQSMADIFVAISGQLYVLQNGSTTFKPVQITDGTSVWTFQTSRSVGGTQYKSTLCITTGTKLTQVTFATLKTWAASTAFSVGDVWTDGTVYYKCITAGTSGATQPTGTVGNTVTDGTVTWLVQSTQWSANTVTPYTPTVQEAIYIGTNALAANPSGYIQDGSLAGSTSNITIAGISPATQMGAVNTDTLMTAFVNKTSVVTSVKYQWSYKKSSDTNWTVAQAWATDSAGKSWTFHPDTAVPYDIKVEVEDATSGTTNTTDYQQSLTNYQVNPTPNKANPTATGIQTCNNCMVYWDRLLIWGDSTNPYQLYISDLQAYSYFPMGNTINFDTGRQEGITAIVRFSDMLYVFTQTSIQGLSGKSPSSYQRYLINDMMGCVAPLTAKVVNNYIIFLANEGIFQLAPNLFRPELGQVKRMDYPVRFQITPDSTACAWVQDAQYWLCYPGQSIIYRLYYDNGMWVQDTSSKLNIIQFYQWGSTVYNLTADGNLYKHDRNTWNDAGETYTMQAESKYFDMEASFNQKKLRRFYIIGKAAGTQTDLNITIKADAVITLSPYHAGYAQVNPDGTTSWIVPPPTPNFEFFANAIVGQAIVGSVSVGTADLGVQWTSVHGKARRIKVIISHNENDYCEVYGFGMEYKLKRANAR